MSFDLDLGGESVQVAALVGDLGGECADVDGLPCAVQLGDLLLERLRGQELLGAVPRRKGGSNLGAVMIISIFLCVMG